MKINRNRYSHNFKSTIFIDFQYQSINCYWLLLIIIDFIDYRKPLIDNAGRSVGGVEISNLYNHRVAKQSKAGLPKAESSGGESTMLSAYFAEAICGKQALKNCFLLVRGPRFWDLRFQDTKNSPFYAATKLRNVCHGHDCRKIKVLHDITDCHFTKYRFHSAKYRFSFRKVQISFRFVSFRKVQ